MRSAVLLVGGFVLLAGGIAVLALEVPGRWIAGPLLIVVGIALKLVGVLRDPRPAPVAPGRTKTTLGTAPASTTAAAPVRALSAQAARRARQTGQVS